MVVGGQRRAPATLPPEKTRYPLYRRLGEPQILSGQVRKISPPLGYDPRTVQPVASRCTDSANLAPLLLITHVKFPLISFNFLLLYSVHSSQRSNTRWFKYDRD